MSLMAANEESDSSAILNGFWVTLFSDICGYYFFINSTLRRTKRPNASPFSMLLANIAKSIS